jgi:hypothetical protein
MNREKLPKYSDEELCDFYRRNPSSEENGPFFMVFHGERLTYRHSSGQMMTEVRYKGSYILDSRSAKVAATFNEGIKDQAVQYAEAMNLGFKVAGGFDPFDLPIKTS